MRTFTAAIGCDDPAFARSLQEFVTQAGFVCEPRHVVDRIQLADRVGLDQPSIALVLQGDSAEEDAEHLRELAQSTASHVIMLGAADDPRRILAALQAGATEYVDIANWQSNLRESLSRFRSRSQGRPDLTRSGQIIGVASPGGGAGATTVAANLGLALARRSSSAMLIDLRLRSGDLAPLLNLQPSYSIADLCHNVARLDDDLFSQILTSHPSGLKLLSAPLDYAERDEITLKGLRRAMSMGKRRFPSVVIDLGQPDTPLHLDALAQCETLLIVFRLDYPSIRNTRRLVAFIESGGYDREKIRLVVNRYGQRYQIKPAQAQEALGMPISAILPEDMSRVNYAVSMGMPIVEYKPRSPLAKRIIELSEAVTHSKT